MVRLNSDENSASPTPSVESLSEASTVGSFQDPSDSIDSNSLDKPNSSSTSSTTSSGLDMSPLDCAGGTKCPVCGSTFSNPKVLLCFHTFCGGCLNKVLDENDTLTCPQCHTETPLGPSGIDGLLCDFGVTGLIDTYVSGSADYQSTSCTSCKSQETHAVARCLTCSNFLCPSCVMAHQFMHCFEGHCVTTLGEITSKEGSRHGIEELESINRLVQEGKVKASEIQMNLKNLESSLIRLSDQYDKVQGDVNDTFKFYTMNLEERRAELLKELEAHYTSKQMAISEYSQKAQEIVDKLSQGTDFIERLMKNASNGEVLLFKKTLEQEFGSLLAKSPEVNFEDVCDFKFCFNNQAIQQSVKATFGFIRSKQDETVSIQTNSGSKQPPISRPTVSGNASTMSNGNQVLKLSNCAFGNRKSNVLSSSTADNNAYNNTSCHNALTSGLVQSIASLTKGSGVTSSSLSNGIHDNLGPKSFCERQQMPYTQTSALISPLSNLYVGNSHVQNVSSSGSGSNYYQHNNTGLLSKRLAASSQFGHLFGNMESLGTSNVNGLNPWATVATDKMHFNGFNGDSKQQFGFSSSSRCSSVNGSNTSDSMMDLSSKLLVSQQQSLFPPKSQIKRQKMIYHCKFGEFGILGGQFTEPSGVAVNAQNDIIVADTNNHRVQIFDKEGRFKFQFGECGKKDGQLLYPNRVAVVKNSGDIIVTERSPTHQVQIYNQYGQFVRKFGANILQHPRGVCVDNKGRIIIVECKVMRVIIFDQMGNVLNKFGCSKHLEFPNGVMVNDRQEIFISDNRAHCVKVFNYDGVYQRQIGGEGITNYPIGVGINAAGEIAIADNHNNFNLTIFSQDGQLLSALESKVKHAQCFDVALMDDGSVVLASKDYRLYIYRYIQQPQVGMMTSHPMLISHQMTSHQIASMFNA